MVSSIQMSPVAHGQPKVLRFAGSVNITNVSFSAPETITHTTVRQSSIAGKKEESRTEKKPLAAEFTVKGDVSELVEDVPSGNTVVFSLKEGKDDELTLTAKYTKPVNEKYTEQETRRVQETYIGYEERAVGQRWVPEEKIWYSWVPAHYEDITSTVPVEKTRYVDKKVPVEKTRTVDKEQKTEVSLKDPKKFLALYELLSQEKKPAEALKELVDYLKTSGNELLQNAVKTVEEELKAKVKAAQDLLKQFQGKKTGKAE